MSGWPLALLLIALIAAPFGWGALASAATAEAARLVCGVFAGLFVVALVLRALRRLAGRPGGPQR